MNASDWLRTWRIATDPHGESCGSGAIDAGRRCVIPYGEPVLEIRHKEWPLGTRAKKRCLAHKPDGWPVDWDAIEAARARVEAAQRAAAAERAELEARGIAAPPAQPLTPAKRIRPVRRPLGFTQVAAAGVFDPKRRAANDD